MLSPVSPPFCLDLSALDDDKLCETKSTVPYFSWPLIVIDFYDYICVGCVPMAIRIMDFGHSEPRHENVLH